MARVLTAALFAAIVSASSTAHAQSQIEGARLSWVRTAGTEGCPTTDALQADVVRRLRNDPFVGVVTQTIEGVVRRDGERWIAQLFNRGADGSALGSRELTSDAEDCTGLADAVALAIALSIDPEAALEAPPEEPPPTETEAPVQPPEPVDEPVATDEPDEQVQVSVPIDEPAPPVTTPPEEDEPPATSIAPPGIYASFVVAIDLVPDLAPAVAIASDARLYGPLRWRLGFLYAPEARTDAPTAEFGFGLTAATLDVCLEGFRADILSLTGCVGGSLGAIHAVVYDPIPTAPGDRAWGAARVTLDLVVELGRFFAIATILGTFPFVRHRFFVEGRPSTEFQQPFAIPAGSLGAGIRFL